MPSRRRRLLPAAAALAAACLAFTLWPRGPRLELYTSPPITRGGKTVRVQVRVPQGWKPDGFTRMPRVSTGPGFPAPASVLVLAPVPDRWLRWTPAWLRKRLLAPHASSERVMLTVADSDAVFRHLQLDGAVHRLDLPADAWSSATHYAYRGIRGAPTVTVSYSTPDGDWFETAYRPICESLRVVP